jgi:hypothetical protein
LKSKKFYDNFWGSDENEVKAEVSVSMNEFESLFNDHGTLTQPTKDNNPKSTVYIKELKKADIENIFGDMVKKLKVQTYNKPKMFEKQVKMGTKPLTVNGATINYSSKTLNLKIKFDCSAGDGKVSDEE